MPHPTPPCSPASTIPVQPASNRGSVTFEADDQYTHSTAPSGPRGVVGSGCSNVRAFVQRHRSIGTGESPEIAQTGSPARGRRGGRACGPFDAQRLFPKMKAIADTGFLVASSHRDRREAIPLIHIVRLELERARKSPKRPAVRVAGAGDRPPTRR